MTVAAIILAAGASRRFGCGNKLTAELAGTPIVRRVLRSAETSKATPIHLVVAPEHQALCNAAGHGRWRSVIATDADDGMAASLKAGIASLPPETSAAIVLLADMPWLAAAHIDRLIAAYEDAGGGKIVLPCDANGKRGNPVVFPKALFPEFANLTGDSGARRIVDAHPELQHPVIFDDDAIFRDVDTPADLRS